jgi:uncharacterized membrane protein (UPF0182 family)
LIRVAMMYNDKIGYGPTVGDALNGLFGPGAGATATGIQPTDGGTPQAPPPTPASPPAPAAPPGPAAPPTAVPPVPDGSATTLSAAKAAALQEIQAAIGAAKDAQKKGDFAAYGAALQRLDDAINKYNTTK